MREQTQNVVLGRKRNKFQSLVLINLMSLKFQENHLAVFDLFIAFPKTRPVSFCLQVLRSRDITGFTVSTF